MGLKPFGLSLAPGKMAIYESHDSDGMMK